MVARFNNGISSELRFPLGQIDLIINPASKIKAIFAIISGWGIWIIPVYYLFDGMFIISGMTFLGIFILPQQSRPIKRRRVGDLL